MKRKMLVRTCFSFGFAAVLLGQSALAQVKFSDDFNSYANDAALLAVWTRATGTAADIGLAPDPSNPANQTIQQSIAAGRLRHVIAGLTPTDAKPLIYSFDLYDSNGGTANGRTYAEIRNSGAATGLLAAGIYNTVNVGVLDITKYQARAVSGGGWIQLDAPRSIGWHNFRFEIYPTKASLYVDGTLQPTFNSVANVLTTYDWLHLGSALAGNSPALFDNVSISVVPEPGALALLLLALGAFAGRGLRRK